MQVSDILRRKGSDVVTVRPDTTVAELLATLAEHGIGAAVVSNDGRTVEGIVSERDVVRAMARDGSDSLARTVGSICTREVAVAARSDRLEDLAATMTEGRFRHLPVVTDGELAGIISIGDVVKSRLSELEQERDALTEYLTSGG